MPFLDGNYLKDVYSRARKKEYGFIASNIAEPNILMGLLDAYREANSDLVLQISSSASRFAGNGDEKSGLRAMSQYIKILAENYDIGVFLNLDHFKKKNIELIRIALEENLTSSIMIDASKESFAENVKITREVVKMAEDKPVLIEGELGKIKGVEDEETASDESFYTDPDEAVEFVRKTGVDLLAISVGTQHGVSKGKDIKLKVDLADKINQTLLRAGLKVPLVLHGTSGLMENQIKEILKHGVCKLNKDTRYQYEYARTALDFYMKHKKSIVPPEDVKDDRDGFFSDAQWSPDKSDFDPRVVSGKIRERIKEVALLLIKQAGSGGQSEFVKK